MSTAGAEGSRAGPVRCCRGVILDAIEGSGTTYSVAGNVNPLMEKSVPVTLACEIVRVAPPVFVSVSDLLLELPTCTLPKATLAGFALSVPLPCPVPSNGKAQEFIGGGA